MLELLLVHVLLATLGDVRLIRCAARPAGCWRRRRRRLRLRGGARAGGEADLRGRNAGGGHHDAFRTAADLRIACATGAAGGSRRARASRRRGATARVSRRRVPSRARALRALWLRGLGRGLLCGQLGFLGFWPLRASKRLVWSALSVAPGPDPGRGPVCRTRDYTGRFRLYSGVKGAGSVVFRRGSGQIDRRSRLPARLRRSATTVV